MSDALARWMTRSELAKELRVSEDTVRSLEAQGKLPPPVYLTPRLPRYDRLAVDAALGQVRNTDDAQFADKVFNAIASQKRPKGAKAPRGRHR
ncbi:helix-turn-helix transcriptional regulator [Azospirillum argentinense]|uniref:helix-turn-helix transcriptional regulator n=1 Tax=Azospirillum argentinense TaxID=2970906 RepID=UPI00158612DF|nr:hypothetical protein [Azospirillum argentinense]